MAWCLHDGAVSPDSAGFREVWDDRGGQLANKRGRESLESQLQGGQRETAIFRHVHHDSNGVRGWGSCYRVIETIE